MLRLSRVMLESRVCAAFVTRNEMTVASVLRLSRVMLESRVCAAFVTCNVRESRLCCVCHV